MTVYSRTSRWVEPVQGDTPAEVLQLASGSQILAGAFLKRGLKSPTEILAFLDPDHADAVDPLDLPGMELLLDRLQKAIEIGKKICIWGDFDVDGLTSTAILLHVLRLLGANVTYHVPVRSKESHGINLPALEKEIAAGASVILTCDTGIAAHEAAKAIRDGGLELLITDHHDLPPELPPAVAIVNPKLLPRDHPAATLPGAGVAYLLALELFRRAGCADRANEDLDLAALGIIADQALLIGEARRLVQKGLHTLRQNTRVSFRSILELAELAPDRLNEQHIAFELAPRLNAVGRLGDASFAVEFLLGEDLSKARQYALQLEGINADRRLLTRQVLAGALAQLEKDRSLLDDPVLVLAHSDWPAGVIGIVASQLVERFGRPVIMFSSPPGGISRGSARSIESVHITEAIAAQSGMLISFGGHPMAAGLAIETDRIPSFRRAISRYVDSHFGRPPEPVLQPDAYLPLEDVTLGLVAQLEQLAPFGPGNPALLFAARQVRIESIRPLGRQEEHRLVTVQNEAGALKGDQARLLWWQGANWPVPEGWIDLAYTVRSSTYGAQPGLQIEWVDWRPAEVPEAEFELKHSLQALDYRSCSQPLLELEALQSMGKWQIWCEGEDCARIGGLDRCKLVPGENLVIWTYPPGEEELQSVLRQVQPMRAALFAASTGCEALEPFLRRLAGLLKFSIRHREGEVSLVELAAAAGQRVAAVRLALRWLDATGKLQVEFLPEERIRVNERKSANISGSEELLSRLKAVLDETAAFRAYYLRAEVGLLLGTTSARM